MKDSAKDWLDSLLATLKVSGLYGDRGDSHDRALNEAKQIITDKLREARIDELEWNLQYTRLDSKLGQFIQNRITTLKKGKS